jgi:hypothetical protein
VEAIMATSEASNPRPSDQGCIVLLIPLDATRARRLIIPHEVACWLRDELAAALVAPELQVPASAGPDPQRFDDLLEQALVRFPDASPEEQFIGEDGATYVALSDGTLLRFDGDGFTLVSPQGRA